MPGKLISASRKRVTLLMVLVTAALGGVMRGAEGQSSALRRPLTVKLEKLFALESDDRLLLEPVHLVASDSLLYFMDGHRLFAWRYDGNLAWQRGREGAGPGEHRLVSSQALDYASGDLWQYDLRNGRIQIWDRLGRFRRSVDLSMPGLFRVAPLGSGLVAGVNAFGTSFMQLFTLDAPPAVDTVPSPLADYSSRHFPTAASPWLLGCPQGQLVVSYAYDSRIVLFRSPRSSPIVRQSIDPVPTPEIVEVRFKDKGRSVQGHRRAPGAVDATLASTCDDERLYLLYAGMKGKAGQTVDVYRLTDASYIGTFELPVPVYAISVFQDRLVAIRHEPVPALYAWKMQWP